MAATEKKTTKKPYHTPRLVIYGDIRELTEANDSNVGRADGSYGNILKTG